MVDPAQPSKAERARISNSGRPLRAALNFGNRVLVGRDVKGRPEGISVDLARRFAKELGRELQLVEFERAVDVASSADQNLWDICFLAVDPRRAETIFFTPPYVVISGSYMIRKSSGLKNSDQVAHSAFRIGVVEGSAYTLHLSRQPGAENLVEFRDIRAVLAAFDQGKIDGIAGIERAMYEESKLRPETIVLHPPFMQISQAIGVPIRQLEMVDDVRSLLVELNQSGTVTAILDKYGISTAGPVMPDSL